MKPFDLEKALAGAPVVTASGEEVVVTRLALPLENGFRLLVQKKSGVLYGFFDDNGWYGGKDRYGPTLFMAPVEKTVWVNFFQGNMMTMYDTEESANREAGKKRIFGNKAHKITWTE